MVRLAQIVFLFVLCLGLCASADNTTTPAAPTPSPNAVNVTTTTPSGNSSLVNITTTAAANATTTTTIAPSTTTQPPTTRAPTTTSTPSPTKPPIFPPNLLPCVAAWEHLALKEPEDLLLMVDSTGKSVNSLGKYDQCLDIGKNLTRYCTLKYSLTRLNPAFPPPLLGVCIPSACSAQTFEEVLRVGLEVLVNRSDIPIPLAQKIHRALEELEYFAFSEGADSEFHCLPYYKTEVKESAGAMVMIIISFILVAIVIIGTLLDGVSSNWWPAEKMSMKETQSLPGQVLPPMSPVYGTIQGQHGENAPLLVSSTGLPLLSSGGISHTHGLKSWADRSNLGQFFIAFSVVRNFTALLGPSPPSLAFLNGVRAISIAWVILGHSLDYMNYAGVLNFIHVVEFEVQKVSTQVFSGAEFSVDTFFWLSGFLLAYLTLTELQVKRHVNWKLYYIHRIWRLSPSYFFALFFYRNLSIYMGDGPMWGKYVDQVNGTCGDYWWTNVIYVNNFIPHTWKNQCFLWGWYLAVDFQMYIFGPIFLLAYHYRKSFGWALIITLTIGTVIANAIFAHANKLQWNASDPHVYMTEVYGKPYTRAAPWLLGIGTAFLHLEKRKLSKLAVAIGWLISGTVMMLIIYGPASEYPHTPKETIAPKITWTDGESLMYFTFSKVAWSLALSFIMYTFALGYGGFVRRFLGANMWAPLARLTYSTYLWHPIIMFITFYSARQYYVYEHYNFSIMFVGLLVLSFSMAVVMFLVVERPLVNVEKIMLPKKKH